MRRAVLPFLLLLLALGGDALAEDREGAKTPTVAQAALQAAAAHEQGDREELVRLAARTEPDPWLIVDALQAMNKGAAAWAFAEHVKGADAEKLREYAGRSNPPEPAARRAFQRAAAARARRRPNMALEYLSHVETQPLTVFRARVATLRAEVFEGMSKPQQACPAFRQAAATARDLGWLRREERALLGRFRCVSGHRDYLQMRSVSLRLLEVQQERGRERAAADTEHDLGAIEATLGNFKAGTEYLLRAMRTMQAAGDEAWVAHGNATLSIFYHLRGDYVLAMRCAEAAREAFERQGDSSGLTYALTSLANLQAELGNDAEALALRERVLTLSEGGEPVARAEALGNLGVTYVSLKRFEDARRVLSDALEIFLEQDDAEGTLMALLNLAFVDQEEGQTEAALGYCKRARKLAEDAHLSYHVTQAILNTGDILLAAGRHAAAAEAYEEALARAREARHAVFEEDAHAGLADAYLAVKEPTKALQHVRQAMTMRDDTLEGLAPIEQSLAREDTHDTHVIGLRAAKDLDQPAVFFEFLERTRSATLLKSLGGRAALAGKGMRPELAQDLATAREQLVAAHITYETAQSEGGRSAIKQALTARDAARDAYQALGERVQREAGLTASLGHAIRIPPLAAYQASLKQGDVLALYALLPDQAYALVVMPKTARIVSLGESDPIRKACAELAIANKDAGAAKRMAALAKRVVEPLGLPRGTKRLLISPDGELAYVPFPSLAPDRIVAMVPSGTAYGHLLKAAPSQGRGILAVGDPTYGNKLPDAPVLAVRGIERGELHRLPGTRREIDAITGKGDVKLLGEAATEGRFLEAASGRKRWHAVHLACHGLVDAEQPRRSALALTPGDGHEGFLDVQEVVGMRLPSDLVVLSACNTGRGKIAQGEGIVGFTQAFMIAGAPRVICSLWKVDDEATRALMVKFYELWGRDPAAGGGAAAALRDAQAHIRAQEQWKHPYYWAAWVLWGVPD